jgi:hypothetical protein
MVKIRLWATLLASICGGWWSAMSGAFSIPFALAALFLDASHGKEIFAVLAFVTLFICALRMAYRNFPKLKLSCRKEITGCAVPNPDNSMKYFRMLVETDCGHEIENCVGHLIKIEKNGKTIYDHDPRELPFAPAERDDCLSKTIAPGIPYFLDVLNTINAVHAVFIATKAYPTGALNQNREYIFADAGEYILTVSVSGNDVPTATAKLKFIWQGQWFTATMEKMN